ncbi:MAG: TetR/AcrR family transcriptional regulator [Spirochaetales bacterium]|nr:TetR/AcrR family transcriptional regulator [Spirochaetales bacterium]
MSTDNTKSERVRLHFAETAREIIMRDGIEGVSVRKVALKAGYSLGTIYNHFSSLDEILWYTRSLMITDLSNYMLEKSPGNIENIEDLKRTYRIYLEYFINNPNIYRFIYFHHLDSVEKSVKNISESPEHNKQMEKKFSSLMKNGNYSKETISFVMETLIYSILGVLTLITTDNDGVDVESIYNHINELIDFLIKDSKG